MRYADLTDDDRRMLIIIAIGVYAASAAAERATDEQVEEYRDRYLERLQRRAAARMVAEAFGGYDGG